MNDDRLNDDTNRTTHSTIVRTHGSCVHKKIFEDIETNVIRWSNDYFHK